MTSNTTDRSAAPSGAPLLRAVGEALFGERWQVELARALQVSARSVRYWAAGRRIPSTAWESIDRLIKRRTDALNDLRMRIPV